MVLNATGYNTARKWELLTAQVKSKLKMWNVLDKFDLLEFQMQVPLIVPLPHSSANKRSV